MISTMKKNKTVIYKLGIGSAIYLDGRGKFLLS